MGTWGDGLWDGDAQLDTIADFTDGLWTRIDALASAPPTPTHAAQLAALVGILLQLSETYDLMQEGHHDRLVASLARQAPASCCLLPRCRRIMRRVHAGEGPALAARYGGRSGKLRQVLGSYNDGLREPALFAHPAGARLVQDLVNGLAKELDAELEPDLYDAAERLALFGLILVLEPATVKERSLLLWEQKIAEASPEALTGDDGTFWVGYLRNLRTGFAILRRRLSKPNPTPTSHAKLAPPRDSSDWIHLRTSTAGAWQFWSIARHGRGVTEHAGRVGSEGRERTRWFSTASEAKQHLDARVAAQRKQDFDFQSFDASECDAWIQAEILRERARRQ